MDQIKKELAKAHTMKRMRDEATSETRRISEIVSEEADKQSAIQLQTFTRWWDSYTAARGEPLVVLDGSSAAAAAPAAPALPFSAPASERAAGATENRRRIIGRKYGFEFCCSKACERNKIRGTRRGCRSTPERSIVGRPLRKVP